MGSEPIDYAAIIADLETKMATLATTLASLRAAQMAGALGQTGESSGAMATTMVPSASGGEVPVGAFLGKSIPEAAKLCLQIVKRKMTSREIADALKKGGIESTAKSLPLMVHSILTRSSKGNGAIVKLDRSYWGLVEWYPAAMRASAALEKRSDKRVRKSRRARRTKGNAEPALTVTGQATPTSRVTMVLKSKPGTEFSAEDVAPSANVTVPVARMTLGRLVASKQAEKTSAGKYRATSVN